MPAPAVRFKPTHSVAQINWAHKSTRGLIGCWLWNDSPFSAPDLSGRMSPAIGINTPTIVSGTYFGGNAIHFAATNQHATAAATNALNTGGNATVETWVKSTTFQDAKMLVVRDDQSVNRSFHFRGTDNSIQVVSFPSVTQFVGTTVINDNLWHQGVMTIGDGNLTLYIDGKFENSAACTDTWPTSTDPLSFGAFADGLNDWTGDMWMTRMWNRCLSAVEIRQLFHSPTDMFIAPVYRSFPDMNIAVPPTNPDILFLRR